MRKAFGWVLLTFGAERGWGGNSGYDDDPLHRYQYDSFVPNHKRLAVGDIVLVRSKARLLGIAQIEAIKKQAGKKKSYRCPDCKTGHISRRRTTQDFRCVNGHVFESPDAFDRDCVEYQAEFGDSFVPAPNAVSIDDLRLACPRYNRQMAMQRVDLAALANQLLAASPGAEALLNRETFGMDENAALDPEHATAAYTVTNADTRTAVLQSIRERRGQQRFRERLRQRYGNACMVSGCSLFDVVEAAHISPFRSDCDHHPENGLLLRADLHTLFDLNLLGIEPHGLTVVLHPKALCREYSQLIGAVLRCGDNSRPSREALEVRWSLFQAHCSAFTDT